MTARRGRIAATTLAAAAAVTALVGCSTPQSPTPGNTGSVSESTSRPGTAPAPPSAATGAAGVPAEQAARLCGDIESQLQSWRTYTPSIGKAGLNTVVITWATSNGVDLLTLAGDRNRIDAITTEHCSQVRDGALYALEIPTLASALIGF